MSCTLVSNPRSDSPYTRPYISREVNQGPPLHTSFYISHDSVADLTAKSGSFICGSALFVYGVSHPDHTISRLREVVIAPSYDESLQKHRPYYQAASGFVKVY